MLKVSRSFETISHNRTLSNAYKLQSAHREIKSTLIMLTLLALAAIAVTHCNAEAAAAEARDSSGPSRGNFHSLKLAFGEISKIF